MEFTASFTKCTVLKGYLWIKLFYVKRLTINQIIRRIMGDKLSK